MAYATWLPNVLRAAGLNVVTLSGWETRGSSSFNPKGVLWHHTATGPNWSDEKVERLLRDGRPGLSGPLSQLGLRRDGTFVVIAAGRANHAGKGSWGPISGNTSSIGIEAYNSGLGEAWAPEQYAAYVKGTAAMLKHLGQPFSSMAGHKEFAQPRGRKPDPAGIDMEKARVDVRNVMAGGVLKPFDPTDPTQRPTVRRGSSGVHVQNVQTAVGAVGADGKPDGDFGPTTERMVKAWQAKMGLSPDGVFDLPDWRLLLGASEKPSPASSAPTKVIAPAPVPARPVASVDAEGEALTADEVQFVKDFHAESVRWQAKPSSIFHVLRWFRQARGAGTIDGKSYLKQ